MPTTKPKSAAPPANKPHSARKNSGLAKVAAATLRKLRETAQTVRAQVARDRAQIAAEARDVVTDAVARGKLTKLTLLLRPDEQAVLNAIQEYATAHGLKSRNQVLRAALAKLLNINLDQPHWGWAKGRARKP